MLKINREAIARVKALAESRPPLDPEKTFREAIAAGGENFDEYTVMVEPGYICVFTIETTPPLTYNHLSIHSEDHPVTQSVIEQIAKAFGFGERRSWSVAFEAAGAYNVAKIRTS